MEHIYLDHAATSPVHKDVLKVMWPIFKDVYGNPSSVHLFGRQARQYLDEARQVMANSINATNKEIVFTSGGTEANNLALIGTALANQDKGRHIITTEQEHQATLNTMAYLESKGFQVTYLQVDKNGQIHLDDLVSALTDNTILVSIMYVNNETGIIQPIEEIGHALKEHHAYFHTDAVQAYELLNIDVQSLEVDLLTVSSHKINGPKGVGFLYVNENVKINPIQFGGKQERKRRAGTENIPNIVGFKKAVEIAKENRLKSINKYNNFKYLLIDSLKEARIHLQINGDENLAIPSIVSISFPGTTVESLLTNFDLEGIAASSGSACTAGSIEPSHVLVSMFGKTNERIKNSVRFSFGINNTNENIKLATKRITKIIKRLTV